MNNTTVIFVRAHLGKLLVLCAAILFLGACDMPMPDDQRPDGQQPDGQQPDDQPTFDPPTGLSITSVVDNTAPGAPDGVDISISWTPPADTDFSRVLIDWAPNGPAGPVSVFKGTGNTFTTATNTPLPKNVAAYEFSVRAVGAVEDDQSEAVKVRTAMEPLLLGVCGDLSPSNTPILMGNDPHIIASGSGGESDPFIIPLSANCANIAFAWNIAGLSTGASVQYLRFTNLRDNTIDKWETTLVAREDGRIYTWVWDKTGDINDLFADDDMSRTTLFTVHALVNSKMPITTPFTVLGSSPYDLVAAFRARNGGTVIPPEGTFRIDIEIDEP